MINSIYNSNGTRFKLFPQPAHLTAFPEPEIVTVSLPAGSILPGPSDSRMYVVDPIDKPQIYDPGIEPPYLGPIFPPAEADEHGHFDYLEPGSRAFVSAHMYGAIRFVLDIWETYLGHTVEWHFADFYQRLELVPFVDWDNAHSGPGFIEFGYFELEDGGRIPHSLNFDVLAHEIGHTILFSVVGLPSVESDTNGYRGFQESGSDLIALISVLHFNSVLDDLLQSSSGNLYTLNELNRIGEVSNTEQIRLASNDSKLLSLPREDWDDEHDVGLPLMGAIFDIFVDIFTLNLAEMGLISNDLLQQSYAASEHDETFNFAQVQQRFDDAYRGQHQQFKHALIETRDYMGLLLASSWQRLSPHYLNYDRVAAIILAMEQELSGGRFQDTIIDCFAWRGIYLTQSTTIDHNQRRELLVKLM